MWPLSLRLCSVLAFSLPLVTAAGGDDDWPPGYLGVYLDDVEDEAGGIVRAVIVGSPAKKTIAAHKPGTTVSLRIRRGETGKQLTAELAKRPELTELLISDDPPRVFAGTFESDGGTLVGSLEGSLNTICNSRGLIIQGSIALGESALFEVLLDDHPDVNGLQVDGDIVLDGILHVVRKGAAAKPGDQFELITGGKSLKGRFKRLILPKPPDGVRWEIVYDNLDDGKDLNSDGDYDVTLTAVPAGK